MSAEDAEAEFLALASLDPGAGHQDDEPENINSPKNVKRKAQREAGAGARDDRITPHDAVEMLINGPANIRKILIKSSNGMWFAYDGSVWKEYRDKILPDKISNIMWHGVCDPARACDIAFIKKVIQGLGGRVLQERIIWNRIDDNEIAFSNGIYNVSEDCMRPHNSKDRLNTIIPHDLPEERGQPCPVWHQHLRESFRDSNPEESTLALQEFMGYILFAHSSWKKALMMQGAPNTGKSVVLQVMEAIVGEDQISGVALDKLDNPRAAAELIGSRLNSVSELPADVIMSDSGFKKLVSSGNETITVDPKNVHPYTIIPTATFIIATNNLPRIMDRSGGVWARVMLILFPNVVELKDQDPRRRAKLMNELPGIIQWAVKGARRLTRRVEAGEPLWTEIPGITEVMEQIAHEENPVAMFIEECCEDWGRDESHGTQAVTMREFVDAMNEWMNNGRNGRGWGIRSAADELRRLGYIVKKARRDEWGGRHCTAVMGIKLGHDPAPSDQNRWGDR